MGFTSIFLGVTLVMFITSILILRHDLKTIERFSKEAYQRYIDDNPFKSIFFRLNPLQLLNPMFYLSFLIAPLVNRIPALKAMEIKSKETHRAPLKLDKSSNIRKLEIDGVLYEINEKVFHRLEKALLKEEKGAEKMKVLSRDLKELEAELVHTKKLLDIKNRE